MTGYKPMTSIKMFTNFGSSINRCYFLDGIFTHTSKNKILIIGDDTYHLTQIFTKLKQVDIYWLSISRVLILKIRADQSYVSGSCYYYTGQNTSRKMIWIHIHSRNGYKTWYPMFYATSI